MLKILTVVGARPQFIKASVVSRALSARNDSVVETLVHTGQHYDEMLSEVFFRELGIPTPKHSLDCGGGSHGQQTSLMLAGLERVLLEESPDVTLVYGDTNSTLAGALAAAKLGIPIAHVEAGLRSFNRRMPEEINRLLTDHVSKILFAPSAAARQNLAAEGILSGVHVVGDVMLDAAKYTLENPPSSMGKFDIDLPPRPFGVLTLHRASITENLDRLIDLLERAARIGIPLVYPVHPRVQSLVGQSSRQLPKGINYISPIGHHQMLSLVQQAQVVFTDSGGLQKEAYFLRTPCVTLRTETEWTETVATGWNVLCDPHSGDIEAALLRATAAANEKWIPLYGDGAAAKTIVDTLVSSLS